MSRAPRQQRGFTIIELVTVMVLAAVLGLIVWRNVAGPLRAFADLSRRAELVDAAETALQRMRRELRLALPNSVRVNADGTALEFLRTAAGGRYRAEADISDPGSDPLDFSLRADSFEVLGGLAGEATLDTGSGGLAACQQGAIDCVAIYNSGAPSACDNFTGARANAWCGDNLAGLAGFDAATERLSFDRADAATPLPFQSPTQRFFVVDTPVSFVCDNGVIRRYAGYPIAAAQPEPPATTPALLATQVESCQFSYAPGTSHRAGLVTIRLVLAARNLDDGREAVTLLQQVPIVNTP